MTESDTGPEKKKKDDKAGFISRFKILAQLGAGGMGVVYKAHDPHLDKTVGLKVIKSTVNNEKLQVRFQKEAKALKDLRHQNIPEIYNFAISRDNEPYLVLEYVEGKSLAEIIASTGPMNAKHAAEVLLPVCEALAYAHANGIVHRDIKPANIILSESDPQRVKLIDFGLAKLEDDIQAQVASDPNLIMGSPPYMSPEQIRNQPASAQCDIYSIGCVLFEMITGSPPYRGETSLETISMHLNIAIESRLAEIEPDRDPEQLARSIIKTCLQKEPQDRFENIDAVLQALKEILEEPLFEEEAAKLAPSDNNTSRSSNRKLILSGASILLLLTGAALYTGSIINDSQSQKLAASRDDSKDNMYAYDWFDSKNWTKLGIKGNAVYNGGQKIEDEDFKKLNNTGTVNGITCIESDKVTGAGLKHLRRQPVRSIFLASPNLDDRIIEEAFKFKNLRTLSIGHIKKISLKGLKNLKAFPTLRKLAFRSCLLPPGSLAVISEIEGLETLTLGGCGPLTPDDLKELKKLKHLQNLMLDHTRILKPDYHFVKTIPALKRLFLVNVKLTDKDVQVICQKKLTSLDLSNNPITKKSLAYLAHSKSLKFVRLCSCKMIKPKDIQEFQLKNPHIQVGLLSRAFKPLEDPVDIFKNYP